MVLKHHDERLAVSRSYTHLFRSMLLAGAACRRADGGMSLPPRT